MDISLQSDPSAGFLLPTSVETQLSSILDQFFLLRSLFSSSSLEIREVLLTAFLKIAVRFPEVGRDVNEVSQNSPNRNFQFLSSNFVLRSLDVEVQKRAVEGLELQRRLSVEEAAAAVLGDPIQKFLGGDLSLVAGQTTTTSSEFERYLDSLVV